MYEQDSQLNIKRSTSKNHRETQFGPWNSQTVPLTILHRTQNQNFKIHQVQIENKHELEKNKINSIKPKRSFKYIDYVKRLGGEQKNYKLQILRNEEQFLVSHQNGLAKQRSQKYLGEAQSCLSKSKILSKLKSKLNAIDCLQNSPASTSLTKSRQVLIHKAELKEIQTNFHRYNEQMLSNRQTKKKSKGYEKYLEASLLRTLKSHTDKLLSIDKDISLNKIYKTKSNKIVMHRQFNIIKARNSVTKGKQKVDLQLKRDKIRLTPLQVSFV